MTTPGPATPFSTRLSKIARRFSMPSQKHAPKLSHTTAGVWSSAADGLKSDVTSVSRPSRFLNLNVFHSITSKRGDEYKIGRSAEKLPVVLVHISCLYQKTKTFSMILGDRIRRYFQKKGLEENLADELHARTQKDYGSALYAFTKKYGFDIVEYDRYVHGGIPLDEIIKPNSQLERVLKNVNGHMWVIAETSRSDAQRILSTLGLEHLFKGIVVPNFSNGYALLDRVKDMTGCTDDTQLWIIDQNVDNMIEFQSSKLENCKTICTGPSKEKCDFTISTITELPLVVPQLFKEEYHANDSENTLRTSTASIHTIGFLAAPCFS